MKWFLAIVILVTVTAARGATPASAPAAADPVALGLASGSFDLPRLIEMGPDATARLLDSALPDTAPGAAPAPRPADMASMIAQLAAADGDDRELATRRLIALGPEFGGAVERAAQEGESPEIRGRAHRIMREWRRTPDENARLQFNLYEYGRRLRDPRSLEVLCDRTRRALEAASPGKPRRTVLHACIRALAAAGDDRYTNALRPLMQHPEDAVAVLVADAVGSGRSNDHFPMLLLGALKDPRPHVVDAALSRTPNCWDAARADAVRRAVRDIFDGANEKLKFAACFPLMHDWQDADAIAYLVMQIRSPDRDRALHALRWLGDARNSRHLPPPGLLEAAGPLLRLEDLEMRMAAAECIGTYESESVLRMLIPLLGSSAQDLRYVVFERLQFLDRDTVRRVLNEAARSDADADVRARARLLLQHPELASGKSQP